MIWLQNIAKCQSKSVPEKFHGLILNFKPRQNDFYEIQFMKSFFSKFLRVINLNYALLDAGGSIRQKFVNLTYEVKSQVNSQVWNFTLSYQLLSLEKFV